MSQKIEFSENLKDKSKLSETLNTVSDEIEFSEKLNQISPIEITWNNLTVTTPSGEIILDDISGQIKPGSAVGLLGPSGCGKTTLINVLTGNIKGLKVKGDVYFNNERININHTSKLIAHVSQDLHNYQALTALETLIYYAELKNNSESAKIKSETLLREFGLHGQKNENWTSLSGGEKLRLAIAAAMLKDTPVMILDEPTSGLDSASAMIVIEKMEELAKSGKTLLISIHQPSEEILSIFDEFILMSKGNIVFIGTMKTAEEHFGSLGFVNDKKTVNCAEFYSRIVAVDFRSADKTRNSSANILKILEAWKSKNIKYNITVAPVSFNQKLNSTIISLSKIFLKIDLRAKKELAVYILSMIIFSAIYWAFFTYRVFFFTKLILFDSMKNLLRQELIEETPEDCSFKRFMKKHEKFDFNKENFEDLLEFFNQHKSIKLAKTLYFMNLFAIMFSLSTLTFLPFPTHIVQNEIILKKDFKTSIITAISLVTSVLLHIFPYMIAQFMPICVFFCGWNLFEWKIVTKTFIIYILVSYIAYMFYTSLILVLPFSTGENSRVIYWLKTLGPSLLKAFVGLNLKEYLPYEYEWFKTKSYKIENLFLPCLEDEFWEFLSSLKYLCATLTVVLILTVVSAIFSYSNPIRYKKVNTTSI